MLQLAGLGKPIERERKQREAVRKSVGKRNAAVNNVDHREIGWIVGNVIEAWQASRSLPRLVE